MKCQIKQATEFEFTDVYRLLCELVDAEIGDIDEVKAKEIYINNLNEDSKGLYIAVLPNEIIGFMSVSFDMRLSEIGTVGIIDELVVDKRYRGRGIGTAFVNYAKEVFADRGCILIEVSTNIRRTETHLFYEKLGFIKNGYRFGMDNICFRDKV